MERPDGKSAYALLTPSFFRIVIIGHQFVKADWNRLRPTKAVTGTRSGARTHQQHAQDHEEPGDQTQQTFDGHGRTLSLTN